MTPFVAAISKETGTWLDHHLYRKIAQRDNVLVLLPGQSQCEALEA